MSEAVKRYDCTNGGARFCNGCYQMSEDNQGDYVLAADHDRIVSSLTESGVKMQAERDQLKERCRELEDRNERIRDHSKFVAEGTNKIGAALRAVKEALGLPIDASVLEDLTPAIDTLRAEVERLTGCLQKANEQAEHFEREWYLRGDEVERLTALQLPPGHLPMPRRMLELLIGDPQDPYRANAESVASEMLSGALPAPESHEREFSAVRNVRLLLAEIERLRSALSHAEDWVSAAPHGDSCFVSNHYDADPGSRCNCGKDSALEAIGAALEASR